MVNQHATFLQGRFHRHQGSSKISRYLAEPCRSGHAYDFAHSLGCCTTTRLSSRARATGETVLLHLYNWRFYTPFGVSISLSPNVHRVIDHDLKFRRDLFSSPCKELMSPESECNNEEEDRRRKVYVQVDEKCAFAISRWFIIPFTEPIVMRPKMVRYTIAYDLKGF